MFHSLRSRLTLWYALSLAVILAASGFFWHYYLGRELHSHLDQRLKLIAEDVATFYALSEKEPPSSAVGSCQSLDDFLRRHSWSEFVQIRDLNGTIRCFSRNLESARLPFGAAGDKVLKQHLPVLESLAAAPFAGVRLLNLPLEIGGKTVGVVQVGAHTRDVESALERLRMVLATFSPLLLLLITLGGWFLAGRTLAPVLRITRSMRRINAENLSERLTVGNAGREIAELAATFNEMLARLEESFGRVKQFSGDASHELRTPLTILKGETEVALRWAKTPEEFRNMLESNLEEINRMERIIEDLLLLAKSDSGGLPLEKKPVSLSDLMQEIYLRGSSLREDSSLDVVLNLEVDGEVLVQGDELRLRQLFLNLITNAVKYTPAPGRVEISLHLDGDRAVISISDTGIGIPADHLPYIFERFYRVDEARNRAVGGAGLGLAIVKWVVDAHEGHIDVQSMPGVGTTFRVELPIAGPSLLDREAIRQR
ncbi:two-component sensor histidine kinase [Geothermobacter hydrogeniphilus]|uniref:histidine kinase n=1 Tax=Geothermobacter hydrogeniphilus TaxID=1969733 RepID=A0A2K2H7J3_9BACT|nr:heavy metal sensor histidine kinase [Geothermobacter hydrogeniphilus]PNU19229.1 two-component sensor histidine kinase [Geothermobacter hydrogeniphilus]